MRTSRTALRTLLVAAVLALPLSLGACSGVDNFRDLEGVPTMEPSKVALIANVDRHPNLVAICIQGVAFVTSTREYGDAVTRVPELDAKFCTGDVAGIPPRR